MTTKHAIILGLVAGALTSITPVELMFFVPALAIMVLAFKAEGLRRFAALPGFAIVVALALYAPLKWRDFNSMRGLPARCVPMNTLAPSLSDAKVCFSSRTPTYREVEDVLAAAGVTMNFGYCGTGATVLFGMHPTGAPRFTIAARSAQLPTPLR